MLYFLRFLVRTKLNHPTHNWRIKLWADNGEALAKTSWTKMAHPCHQISNISDLVADIIAVRIYINLPFVVGHVKSHQNMNKDETTPLEV